MNTVRHHLTARNVVSAPVVLLSTLWAVFGNFTDLAANGTANYGIRFIVVVVLQAAFFGGVWLGDVLLRRRTPVRARPAALLLLIGLLTVGRGVALGYALWQFGVTEHFTAVPRVIAGFAILAIPVLVLTVSYGMFIESAMARRVLLADREQLGQLSWQADQDREHEHQRVLNRVHAQLAEALQFGRDETPEHTLAILRSSIDDVIRPLSRTLDESFQQQVVPVSKVSTRAQWSAVFRRMLDVRQLRLLPTGILSLAVGISAAIGLWGSAAGVLLMMSCTLSIAVFGALLRAMVTRWWPNLQSIALVPVLLLSGLPGSVVFMSALPEHYRTGYGIGYAGTLLFAGLVPALMSSAIAQSRQQLAAIRQENEDLAWALARARVVSKQERRALTSALHGSVQAALAAAALRLQRALRDGQEVERAVQSAQAEAERAVQFTVDFAAPAVPVSEVIAEVRELWSGVCEVDNQLSTTDLSRIDTDPVCARAAGELVVEMLMNAVKHATATRVELSCRWPDDRTVELVVRNDGGSSQAGEVGGGTRLLEELCLRWQRISAEDHTQVRATLTWQAELPSPGAAGDGGHRARPLSR